MYKDLQRTCTVIVLLIKPFVWWRSRRRRRRGLLKLPINILYFQRLRFEKARYLHCHLCHQHGSKPCTLLFGEKLKTGITCPAAL